MDALQQSTPHPTRDLAPRPRVVDVAVGVTFVAALVNALIGVLLAVQVAVSGVAVNPLLVGVVVAISVVYAAVLVTLALFVRAGRVWARGALASVSALSLLTILALNAFNFVVIVLLVAADVLFYRRSVTVWIRMLRGLPPA